jgi:alkaline phosphatase D
VCGQIGHDGVTPSAHKWRFHRTGNPNMSKPHGSRRQFILQTASAVGVTALAGSLAACGESSTPPAEFKYGVASGDPLSDRVILWTHAKIPADERSVWLDWQVASDSSFANVVRSGRTSATASTGYTAKVDADGLTPGASYYYRFTDDAGVVSPVGMTRTLPAANVAAVKLAVFSCTLYSEGFFNAYKSATASDAQYAVHLGDYIYEYGAAPTQFGNTDAVKLGRVTSPANDIVSLNDYRTRYALYRSDPDLQALHARMPWITIWDDHEFANNAWVGGAENHNASTQGDWAARKAAAAQAYHEWLPIRTPDSANLLKIYRSFDFGSLFTLHMLDTRIEGRDRQYDSFGDADGGVARYVAGLTPNASGVASDSARKMMSTTQQAWLTSGISASKGTWQFLGNQDIMGKMWLPASVLQAQASGSTTAVQAAIGAYLTAKATRAAAGTAALTPTQAALLNTSTNPTLPYNLDSWDGYPSQREAVLQAVRAQGKRLVALSGDSHNAWFNNLTTLAGQKVGVEFAGSSVTSPGFESAGLGGLASSLDGSVLAPQLGNLAIGNGLGLIDDLNYADTIRRGYLLMTITAAEVKGEYVFVSTVKSTTYTATVGRTITVAASNGTVTYA